MIAGFTGIVSLVFHNWGGHPKLHIITYVFSGVLGFFFFFALMFKFIRKKAGCPLVLFGILFISFTVLSALYGDWALGAMTNNLLGKPSGDSAGFYWSYFVLKRLTMFSF